MSDRPHGPDWWADTDGAWYPPEVGPGAALAATAAPGPAPVPGLPLSPGLTVAVQAVMLGSAGAAAGGAITMAVESGSFDADLVRSAPDISEALGAAGALLALWSLTVLAGGILLIVWLYQAYRSVLLRGPTARVWSPGWAVGAWFIPLAALVLPKLVVNEVDRLSHPDAGEEPIGDRWKPLPTLMVGHWWWALTVAASIVVSIGLGIIGEQLDGFSLVERTYRAGLRVTAAALTLWAGGAVTGALVVRTIARRISALRPGAP